MLVTPVFLIGAPDSVLVIVCVTSTSVVGVGVEVSVVWCDLLDFDLCSGCGVTGISNSVVYGDVM